MLNLIRFSEASNLAIHALAFLASSEAESCYSSNEIAKELHVSPNHLAKVLQQLTHNGLIHSTRGAKGGFRLAKGAEKTSLYAILRIVNGPMSQKNCFLGEALCRSGDCTFLDLAEYVEAYLKNKRICEFKFKNIKKRKKKL